MINNLKIYISNSFNPYINLATEKHLLETCGENSLIMYLWQNKNTVVIGKNQNPWKECNLKLIQDENVSVVRRMSGGGAVYHDEGNLNFTFICSEDNYNPEKHFEVIKYACSLTGINADISGRNDILSDGRKFSGNAFLVSGNKACHHGTLLISADTEKMSRYLTPPKAKLLAKGVNSVKSRVLNLSEKSPDLSCKSMVSFMCKAFENVYGLPAEKKEIIINDAIINISKEFESRDYIFGKTLPFSVSFEEYTSLGNFEINLNVLNGLISDMQIYTDANDSEITSVISSALNNCKLTLSDIKYALDSALPPETASIIFSIFERQKIFF